MLNDYDFELYEMFHEQLEVQLPQIENHLHLLSDPEEFLESINALFRYFHTYKSTSAYLKLLPINQLATKSETLLSILREEKNLVEESIVDWLFEVKNQLSIYSQEMESQEKNLSALPQHLLQKVSITTPYIEPKLKLKTLSLLYMDKDRQRANSLLPIFKKLTKSVKYSSESDRENSMLNMKPYDIIVMNLNKENLEIINFCKAHYPNIPLLAVFNKISTICENKLINKAITHSITNPLNEHILQRELLSIVNTYYSSSHILINHKKIEQFIQTLEPLPKTLLQILAICDNEEASIKELIRVVKSDPVVSAIILKAANSPLYSSLEITTIDRAVSKFGKSSVKAFTMSSIYNSLGSINLSAYNIDEEIFSSVSIHRLSLMVKWYSKVSIADLSLLSSTAILSNLGQILLSREIQNTQKDDYFKELCTTFEIEYAEKVTLHTTTTIVSAQILRFLKLNPEIVDVIEYSHNPLNAPSHIRKLALANHIVLRLIDVQCAIAEEIPHDILALMNEYNLETEPLLKALKSLKKSN